MNYIFHKNNRVYSFFFLADNSFVLFFLHFVFISIVLGLLLAFYYSMPGIWAFNGWKAEVFFLPFIQPIDSLSGLTRDRVEKGKTFIPWIWGFFLPFIQPIESSVLFCSRSLWDSVKSSITSYWVIELNPRGIGLIYFYYS